MYKGQESWGAILESYQPQEQNKDDLKKEMYYSWGQKKLNIMLKYLGSIL